MRRKGPPDKAHVAWMERAELKRRIKVIGKNIAYYRKRSNRTQSELAECCGVSDQHIYFIESGLRSPSMELLIKISEVCDIPEYKLMCYQPIEYGTHGAFEEITSILDEYIKDKDYMENIAHLLKITKRLINNSNNSEGGA